MSRTRTMITWGAFAATFLWLLVPDFRHGPAVLWPSLVAVGLAFVTRNIYLSLFLGAFCGAIMLRDGNVAAAFLDLFSRYLVPSLKDPWNVSVLVFTLMMGGLVEVMQRNGGMLALAEWFLGPGHSRRRALMGAYVIGLVIFFDGLANSMLVGKAMRPITDRAGASREKLSFIVDSTSSPVAALALISTWIAYEMSVIRQGFENAGNSALLAEVAPYNLLIQSLPFRYYNYFILLIVFLTIWLNRDYGPMWQAERTRHDYASAPPDADEARTHPARSLLAIIPLAVLIGSVFGGLFINGGGLERPLTMASVIEAFGKADAAMVFVWATALTALITLVLSSSFRLATHKEGDGVVDQFFEGMKQMFLPTLILVFAWTLNGAIKDIGTAPYLVSFLHGKLRPELLPALVFALASLISFSTGTSWGTMAIVMPLVIPVAVKLTGLEHAADIGPVMIATVGGVLTGAVFGDHCSPISDTTIVSAFSSDCPTMDHVRTQMPYALTGAFIALLTGYLPAGFGLHWSICLVLGGAACWAMVRFVGKSSAFAE